MPNNSYSMYFCLTDLGKTGKLTIDFEIEVDYFSDSGNVEIARVTGRTVCKLEGGWVCTRFSRPDYFEAIDKAIEAFVFKNREHYTNKCLERVLIYESYKENLD